MQELLNDAAQRGIHYLATVNQRRVTPTAAAVDGLACFDEELPTMPTDPAHVLARLDEIGSPATVATTGGRYFGFVVGGTLPVTVAANWLATSWDNNGGPTVMSPTAVKLEAVARRWLIDLFGLPAGTIGSFVTGATMANFTGLAAARHALLARQGWDAGAQGLFGAPPLTVVVGDEVHVSVLKALSLLGLGRDRVVRVPVDEQGRMRPDALPRLDDRTILCLQAGNVNTGAFDPMAPLCAAARAAGAWVHIDGAFGMWAAVTPTHAHLTAGMDQADSWATDAHKWLNVPLDSGIAFCRHPEHVRGAMATSAAYLNQGIAPEPYHFTPEMSRRPRGVEVWAALRTLGREGLADLISRTCRYANRFAQGLRAAGYPILNEVVLNQLMVSFGDAATTQQVIAAIQEEGTCWAGGTTWQGRTAMRISVSSWATTAADVEQSLNAILCCATQIRASKGKDMLDSQKVTEIEQKMIAEDVRFVSVALCDTYGVLRAKLLPRARFLSALKSGTGVPAAILTFDATDVMLPMPGLLDDEADFHDAVLEVDPDSGRTIPWEAPHRNRLYLGNFSGATSAVCTRSLLKRVLAKGEAMGFVPRYGLEVEYTLFDETRESIRAKGFRNLQLVTPASNTYRLSHQSAQADWYEAVLELCEGLGIEIAATHEEIGPGFMEVSLAPQDGLVGADQAVIFKNLLRALAWRKGKLVTFMPRWSAQYESQSLHVHLSLVDRAGKPLFFDAGGAHNMSQTMRYFLGGLQRYTKELFLLYAPTVNAYRRFTPDSFAPKHGVWGFENRTCCFRIVGTTPTTLRIENRQPGSDVNPYLAIAGIFAAGLAGIEARIEPHPELVGHGFAQQADPALRFPTTIAESIANLRASQLARSWLGDAFVEAFTSACEAQEAEFRGKVPDTELERFFEQI